MPFPVPPPISLSRVLTDGYLDLESSAVVTACMVGYAFAVVLVRRRGVRWPASRASAWFSGCAVVLVAVDGGLAQYSYVLVSAHMVQHLVVQLIAAPLLALGAPVTLLLRGLRAGRPLRRRLLGVVQGRVASWLTHPAIVLVLFSTMPYVLYLTGVYEWSLRYHWVHHVVVLHLIVVSVAFFAVLIGADPMRHRPTYPVRVVMLLAAAVAHAVFGVAVMQQTSALAPRWWVELGRP